MGTTNDPKPIFVSAMLNDEEVTSYEQLLQEWKYVFAWGYQDMLSLDPISLFRSSQFLKL